MKRYFQKNKAEKMRTQAGFTLLEVLIAITVLSFAVTATFSAAQSGLSTAIESKNQVVSFYLAQEGIEYIRNMRDTNALAGSPSWLTGFAEKASDPCFPGKACTIDVASVAPTACPTPTTCPVLREDGVATSQTYGMFGYNASWAATTYTRALSITSLNANEIELTVAVTVTKGSFTQTFSVKENILNWQS